MKTISVLWAVIVMLLALGLPTAKASDAPASLASGVSTAPGIAGFELRVAFTDATSVQLQWQPQPDASEYQVSRDGRSVGSTIAVVGYFTDFGLRPGETYQYTVAAYNTAGAAIARSAPVSAETTRSTTVRTHYKVLAIAFNPGQASLVTEQTYLKHRIQFLELASSGSAVIELYNGGIVSSAITPAVEPGSNWVNYVDLVTRRDLPGLNGSSIVDLVEKAEIDHVWVVKSPVDFWENALIGNRAIQGEGVTTANTWLPIPVKSSRSFFVNAYTPDERSWDAYTHMAEGVMTSISDGHPELWPRNLAYTVYTSDPSSLATRQALLNVWERFRLTDGWNGLSAVAYASAGNSNIGSSHFPPNTPRECADYCYFDARTWRRYVDSLADDWLSFPQFSNIKRKLNGYDLGAFNNYAEGDRSYSAAFGTSPEAHTSFQHGAASYHQWWFAHLPHNPGVTGGQLNNWWPYIFDFNRFNGALIDYEVEDSHEIPTGFRPVAGEYGTDTRNARDWGYWHSQNGFSPGGKAAQLSIVSKATDPQYVRAGNHALTVYIENAQYWEELGFGRNDVFYPASRNAHWMLSSLAEVQFSIKPGENEGLLVGTNPIVRLYKDGGHRIELVPRNGAVYTNMLRNSDLRDSEGWYNFSIPLAGNMTWEKNVIGYIDPALSELEKQAAKEQLEQDILADLNYVEISIRSTTSQSNAPYDVVSYSIDGLKLLNILPPTANTSTASGISWTAATLNGTVNANNANTTVTFQYTTTSGDYAHGIPITAAPSSVTGIDDTPVSANISGLTPGMTYFYRVVATNSAGTAIGTEHSFTTIVLDPIEIIIQPNNSHIGVGSTATLHVVAAGSQPLAYQWYQGLSGNTNTPVAAATSSTFTTAALTNTTQYWVRISSGLQSIDSNTANITVGGFQVSIPIVDLEVLQDANDPHQHNVSRPQTAGMYRTSYSECVATIT